MVKITKCVTVDLDKWTKAKKLNLNLSGSFNDYLGSVIALDEGNIEGINYELEQQKLQKNREKLSEIQLKVQKSEEILRKLAEKQKKLHEFKLKKEKERIENSRSCLNCGHIFHKKAERYEFPAGFICKSCFMAANNEQISAWNSQKSIKKVKNQ